MKRVLLLGSPGAGKSTFARKLASLISLPVIHLDRYYNDASLGYADDTEAWEQMVKLRMAQPEWIMDGNYSSTIAARIERADIVFLFQYARWRAFLGLLRRRIEYHSKVREDMPDGWRERVDFGFLRFVWDFNKHYVTSKLAAAMKDCPPEKIVIFKNPRDVQRYLQTVKINI